MPGLMELGGIVGFGLLFEVGGIDPDEVELLSATHGAVLERFDDGKVAVMEIGIFADEGYVDTFEESFLGGCQVLPLSPCTSSTVDEVLGLGDGIKIEESAEALDKALLFEE